MPRGAYSKGGVHSGAAWFYVCLLGLFQTFNLSGVALHNGLQNIQPLLRLVPGLGGKHFLLNEFLPIRQEVETWNHIDFDQCAHLMHNLHFLLSQLLDRKSTRLNSSHWS